MIIINFCVYKATLSNMVKKMFFIGKKCYLKEIYAVVFTIFFNP